jgi:protoheme IX farnesyltransferase
MWKTYSDLTKFGIVVFVIISGLAGYATSFRIELAFDWNHLLSLIGGLYFLSSGSLALNQVQEWKIDAKMARTASRPIASGKIKPAAGGILAACFLFIGLQLLLQCSVGAAGLGALTVALYNGVYTYIWKPKWIFGAVPGAIPGALPVTIGYAANDSAIFSRDSVYLFLIMFLWQMPHFWTLAIKFKDDYAKAGVPTLPVALGVERTIYHIGIYTFAYVAVAVASPWLVHASWVYLALVVPLGAKVLQEFYRFFKSKGTERWLAFFLWTNVSMLVFIIVPVIDKWSFLVFDRS